MATIKFWNFMGAVGVSYFCFVNYDVYLAFCSRNKVESDAKNKQLMRAKQRALSLMDAESSA